VGSIGDEPANAASVVPIARARRWTPWVVAGASTLVAAAAIAMLWLRTPSKSVNAGWRSPVAHVPAEWMSRPADSLVGPIARDHAGDASARLDTIFADRLDGFRARRLSRGGKR
jgi:hypothetical protein